VKPPPLDLHKAIAALPESRVRFAIALVLKTEGSTPREAGARAIIAADGTLRAGTIGGGQVEAEAQRKAIQVIRSGEPAIFDSPLEGGTIDAGEPICGGRMRILLHPVTPRHRRLHAAVAAALDRRDRGVLLTVIHGLRHKRVQVQFLKETALRPPLPFPGLAAIRTALRQERVTSHGSEPGPKPARLEVLVEPVVPRPRLVIAGGGHVGQAVAAQASLVGFDLVVVDDRPDFTDPRSFPTDTARLCGPIGEQLAGLKFDPATYVVIVTRGHQHDAEALAVCLSKPAAYLGMIGSRRKVAIMRRAFLKDRRCSAAAFDRVHAPIGLEIGALTVPEIAASIVAELIAVRRLSRTGLIP
jgi:xanthine dehydrogenase accessory factor